MFSASHPAHISTLSVSTLAIPKCRLSGSISNPRRLVHFLQQFQGNWHQGGGDNGKQEQWGCETRVVMHCQVHPLPFLFILSIISPEYLSSHAANRCSQSPTPPFLPSPANATFGQLDDRQCIDFPFCMQPLAGGLFGASHGWMRANTCRQKLIVGR